MRDRELVIYGAGEYGKRLLRFLRSLGVEVDCFCQTKADEGLHIDGVPVISFACLSKMKEKFQILISLGNRELSKSIRLRLASVFMERAEIVECGAFLGKDNYKDNCSGGYCNLCSSKIDSFLPGGLAGIEKVQVFQKHHIIGGGWRERYQCPICGSVDRERWQLWVLSKHTGIFLEPCRVLHFAPEPHISKFIEANPDCEYYTGDIVRGRAMHQTDILDIQYKNGTFRYVIMNHVLEHIEDMARAMSEVKRVLKPEGKLILSFPICTDMDTLELPKVRTTDERLQYYGQEDHVRLFGRDYQQIIKGFGFEVEAYTPKACCSSEEIQRYGFIEDDVLMICRKVK